MTNKTRIPVLVLSCLLVIALLFTGCEMTQKPTDAPGNDPTATDAPQVKLPEEVKTEDMAFQLQRDGTYKLVSYTGTADSVTIPATAGEGKVTAVADACFKGMTGLKKVEITEGVTTLGNEVFSGCTALSEVIIPNTVGAIGHSAFLDTPWLAQETSNPAQKWLIVGDGVLLKFFGQGALGVKVPETVKYISDAFRGNPKLIKITVPGSCKVVGEYAFADCPVLHEISLPLKLDYLANSSVYGCPALELIDNKD